jgi:hypothetical protein
MPLTPSPTSSRRDCGSWLWLPGGARVKPRWAGPTFTLTAARGSCSLLTPTVAGQGSPGWTALQLARLACQGPSLEYRFVGGCCGAGPMLGRGARLADSEG